VRKVLAATGAQVLDAELLVARAADAFDTDGELRASAVQMDHRSRSDVFGLQMSLV
jgi:hypothetical protein